VHGILNRHLKSEEMQEQLSYLIFKIRKDHPSMCMRSMYYKIQPDGIGRDKFEALCNTLGLKAKRWRNYARTTDSTGVIRFNNLIEGLVVKHLNQAWVSDITYYEVNDRFYYITFITDLFSRRILGYQVSKSLSTLDTTVPALRQAIKARKKEISVGLIFHSDGGGQYYCKEFLAITSHYKMRNSMCKAAWENGVAERVNGTIKNNYLKFYEMKDYQMLIKKVDRAVHLYNHEKPHKSLHYLTPVKFEQNRKLKPEVIRKKDKSEAVGFRSFGSHRASKNVKQKTGEAKAAPAVQSTFSSAATLSLTGCSPAEPVSFSSC
jgi:transposase InsO family protein